MVSGAQRRPGSAHMPRAHPLWSCVAERIQIQRFPCIASSTVFGLQSNYSRWITVTYFLFILYFRNINVPGSPCQVPNSFQLQLMVSAADTWRCRHAKNWDKVMKLTTEKHILRTPEIIQFKICRIEFPRASPSDGLDSVYLCLVLRSPVMRQGL